MCLKFWYYFKSTINSTYLSVVVATNIFGTPTSSIYFTARAPTVFQQQWLYARTNMTVKDGDKINITAQISDPNSVIAVDDVLVQSHSCEPMGWCDFESGLREKAIQ
jgi:hypothetical protein